MGHKSHNKTSPVRILAHVDSTLVWVEILIGRKFHGWKISWVENFMSGKFHVENFVTPGLTKITKTALHSSLVIYWLDVALF